MFKNFKSQIFMSVITMSIGVMGYANDSRLVKTYSDLVTFNKWKTGTYVPAFTVPEPGERNCSEEQKEYYGLSQVNPKLVKTISTSIMSRRFGTSYTYNECDIVGAASTILNQNQLEVVCINKLDDEGQGSIEASMLHTFIRPNNSVKNEILKDESKDRREYFIDLSWDNGASWTPSIPAYTTVNYDRFILGKELNEDFYNSLAGESTVKVRITRKRLKDGETQQNNFRLELGVFMFSLDGSSDAIDNLRNRFNCD